MVELILCLDLSDVAEGERQTVAADALEYAARQVRHGGLPWEQRPVRDTRTGNVIGGMGIDTTVD